MVWFGPLDYIHQLDSCWRNSKQLVATAAPWIAVSSLFGSHRWRNYYLDCRKFKFCGRSVRILVLISFRFLLISC